MIPVSPAVKDYSTNLGMGDIAEQMAKNHGIGREEQDRFTLRSHQLAQRAWDEGKLDGEVMRVFVPPFKEAVERDNNIRGDSSLEQLAKLKPAFDRKHGTVTAANSTPLTDGASSMILMKEQRARQLGFEPLGFIRSYAFAAIDPFNDGLMGPSYATPIALDRAGIKLSDLALLDIHEAFAAQSLAVIRELKLDPAKINPLGGAIALGHPLGATGAVRTATIVHGLRRRQQKYGMVTMCIGTGMGAAGIFEAL